MDERTPDEWTPASFIHRLTTAKASAFIQEVGRMRTPITEISHLSQGFFLLRHAHSPFHFTLSTEDLVPALSSLPLSEPMRPRCPIPAARRRVSDQEADNLLAGLGLPF